MTRSVAGLAAAAPVQHNTTAANIAGALAELDPAFARDHASQDARECHARASSAFSPAPFDQRPAAVLFPGSTEEVSGIVRICHARRIPVVAYSGGTSVQGGIHATRGGFCIDFRRMDRILAIHAADMDAVVQPAVGWRALNAALAPHGLFFPPDPGPDARIGGMVATSCAGTNGYRYGTMKESVISLTVVLADGTVVRTRNRPRKCSAGYDLTRLLVGSEGTLGLVTEAVVKLVALPAQLHVAVATFPDLHAATRAGLALVHSGYLLEAIELLDDRSIHAINRSKLSPIAWKEQPSLFLKFAGQARSVEDQVAAARRAAEDNGCTSFTMAPDAESREVWWDARKKVANAYLALKQQPSDLWIPSDVAVPLSRLADLMVSCQEIAARAGVTGFVCAHVGDGNIHVVFICPAERGDHAHSILAEVQRLAISMEGTITGEHGIGLLLRDLLVEEIGDNTVDMMRQVKLALDPHCILNPDKVFYLEKNT